MSHDDNHFTNLLCAVPGSFQFEVEFKLQNKKRIEVIHSESYKHYTYSLRKNTKVNAPFGNF